MIKSPAYYEMTKRMEVGDCEDDPLSYADNPELTHSERLECIGNYHFYKKQHQKAVDYFERAMLDTPDYHCARYHYLLGVQEEMKQRFGDAMERYVAAIDEEPTFVDPYIEAGGLMLKIGEPESAARFYEKALELDPNDLGIYENLVQTYRILASNSREFDQKRRDAEALYKKMKMQLKETPKGHDW